VFYYVQLLQADSVNSIHGESSHGTDAVHDPTKQENKDREREEVGELKKIFFQSTK